MTGSLISIIVLTISFAAFAFVIAFIIFSILSANQREAEKRLQELKKREGEDTEVAVVKQRNRKKQVRKDNRKKGGFFDKLATKLYKQLLAADIKMRPEEFLMIWVLVAIVPASLVIMLVPDKSMLAIILLAVGAFGPLLLIKNRKKSRVKKFDEQLSDALMIACSCLRSGLTFTQAMETIAKDMDDPISGEFATALAEMNMGSTSEEALDRMHERIDSDYLSLMISAVLVQRQTGGNLSQILDTISNSIKEKLKLQKELNTSTSSGKMTGMIVGVMPIAMLLLFTVVNRSFMMPLFTTSLGKVILGVAAGLEIICFVVIKKITTVKM